MHRINVSLPDEDYKLVKRHCLKIRPYQPVGTTIREILLQAVTPCNTALQAVPCPDPARAHEPSNPEKNTSIPKLPTGLAKRVADHLNSKAGTGVRSTGKAFRGYMRARLNEGYTEEDIIRVIDFKAEEWAGTDYEQYLRPQTLFSPENFEKYAAQKGPLKRAGGKGNRPAHQPYTIKASDVGRSDVAPGDLFKHAEVDDR